VATVCFLGGWQVPGVPPAEIAAANGWAFLGWQALSFAVFACKATALVLLVIQLRWTLPRLRVDQLMITCWKYLVPLSFVCLLGTLVLLAVVPPGGLADLVLRVMLVTSGAFLAFLYVRRIRQTYLADRDLYRRMEGKELWYPPYRLP